MSLSSPITDSLRARAEAYRNDADSNERLHQEFTALVAQTPLLAGHRRYVEEHRLGFGDAAFHYMWLLLLDDLAKRVQRPRALEIGVYKGQVISLWSLLARDMKLGLSITAISPFAGNPLPSSRWTRLWRRFTSSRYRQDVSVGNIYDEEDYLAVVRNLFAHFGQDFTAVRCLRGFSSEPAIVAGVRDEVFDLIYIDGDHSFEGVQADLRNYASLLAPRGILVMDDAGYYLPGNTFWKGHEEVSRACEGIEDQGFDNILNVGHNRVYQKRG